MDDAIIKSHGDLGCHRGYKRLSVTEPTVYCACTLGLLARSMDADPLDSHKAERWERVCRSRATADQAGQPTALSESGSTTPDERTGTP